MSSDKFQVSNINSKITDTTTSDIKETNKVIKFVWGEVQLLVTFAEITFWDLLCYLNENILLIKSGTSYLVSTKWIYIKHCTSNAFLQMYLPFIWRYSWKLFLKREIKRKIWKFYIIKINIRKWNILSYFIWNYSLTTLENN